jgi:hypothetical protein
MLATTGMAIVSRVPVQTVDRRSRTHLTTRYVGAWHGGPGDCVAHTRPTNRHPIVAMLASFRLERRTSGSR